MRRIAISSIKGTEILAKDLFSEDGKFILPAGSPLKPDQIPYLEGFGVTHLLIEHDEIVFEVGIEEKIQNECGEKVTEETFRRHLYAPDVPDPDLVIRTSGELRTSNFLWWESAYAEYYFTDTLWPDFSEKDLDAALASYAARHRRKGGL